MRTIFYTLILIGTLIYPKISRAQKMESPQVANAEIKDRISKYYKFQDAYLFTLTDEQRRELFYHRRKGENVTSQMRETDVKYDEQRFQRIKEKYNNMTDAQRDSLIRAHYYRDDMTFEIKLVPLNEGLFPKSSLKDMEHVFQAFKGSPIYHVIRGKKNENGEVVVLMENFLFHKTLYGFKTIRNNAIKENF